MNLQLNGKYVACCIRATKLIVIVSNDKTNILYDGVIYVANSPG